jgi:hypothetical protein
METASMMLPGVLALFSGNYVDSRIVLKDVFRNGRTSYPLLFGRDGKPKPASDAVVKIAMK